MNPSPELPPLHGDLQGQPPPSLQRPLPVAELIGLRFSLLQLRVVGYGLLLVWCAEMVNLLSSSDLLQVAPRLHYISQFLDLSPVLLVALALVGFQGGLRRGWLERGLLPLLFALLPLLGAVLFLLAPISIANAVTLSDLQQRLGNQRLQRVEQQLDGVRLTIREGTSLAQLVQRLGATPGVELRLPDGASFEQTRQEALQSLDRERERLRRKLRSSTQGSRQALLRRAFLNAALALGAGAILWTLHTAAVSEMEQAIPYLQWALGATQPDDQVLVLQELLRFQRRCVALSPMALLELLARLLERRLGGGREPDASQEILVFDAAAAPAYPPEPAPAPPAPLWQLGLGVSSRLGGGGYAPPPPPGYGLLPEEEDADGGAAAEPAAASARERRQARRREIERQRASLGWQRLGEESSSPYGYGAGSEDAAPRTPSAAERRRRRQDRARARLALQRFGDYLQELHPEEQAAPPQPPAGEPRQPRPRSVGPSPAGNARPPAPAAGALQPRRPLPGPWSALRRLLRPGATGSPRNATTEQQASEQQASERQGPDAG